MMSLGKQLKVRLESPDDLMEADILTIADRMEEFEKLAHEMRKEQKAYFRAPRGAAKDDHLRKSKDLEKRIDNLLNQMGYDEQQALF